jgi:hypothetical protein
VVPDIAALIRGYKRISGSAFESLAPATNKCRRHMRQTSRTGKSMKTCAALRKKIFPLQRRANQTRNSRHSAPHPDEPRSGVSKDGPLATWFETARSLLLGARSRDPLAPSGLPSFLNEAVNIDKYRLFEHELAKFLN